MSGRRIERSFIRTAQAPRELRMFLNSVLEKWDINGSVGQDAELLTSEIVTNVVRHTNAGGIFAVECEGDVLRIEVSDHSTSPPMPRHPFPFDTTGRGLQIVDEIADRWGTIGSENGKAIWFELSLANHAQPDLNASR